MTRGIIKPLFYHPAEHLYKLMTDAGYRSYHLLVSRLGRRQRFSACNTSMSGWDLSIPDVASFLSAYKEIFVENIYAFKSALPAPRILDLGANIGLSVLYFKRLYPQAEITAYEADPSIFTYLKRNVHGNGYGDVRLVNKAVWDENTTLEFSSEGADGGRAALADDGNRISVEAADIRDILRQGEFDFLKMDIEGAEERVFPACREFLPNIKYIFVEYHSVAGRKQCLDRIVGMLTEAGFRVHLHSIMSSPSPFVEIRTNSGFDLQLNIFAWK